MGNNYHLPGKSAEIAAEEALQSGGEVTFWENLKDRFDHVFKDYMNEMAGEDPGDDHALAQRHRVETVINEIRTQGSIADYSEKDVTQAIRDAIDGNGFDAHTRSKHYAGSLDESFGDAMVNALEQCDEGWRKEDAAEICDEMVQEGIEDSQKVVDQINKVLNTMENRQANNEQALTGAKTLQLFKNAVSPKAKFNHEEPSP